MTPDPPQRDEEFFAAVRRPPTIVVPTRAQPAALGCLSRVVTGIAVPLLLGLLATTVEGRTPVIRLAVVVLAHLYFERRLEPIGGHA